MAYYSGWMDPRFDRTPLSRLKDLLVTYEKQIIPEIRNTALLLKEVSEFLKLPITEIVEFTITDNNPTVEQLQYVIDNLYAILSIPENRELLHEYKNTLFLGAWLADYEKRYKKWRNEINGFTQYYY